MSRNTLSIIVVLLIGIMVATYVFFHESSEDCFVREMKEWSDREGLADKVKGITQDDEKMAVAKAKAVMKEADYNDFNNESQKIYIQVRTLFEYCGIKS